MPSTAEIGRRRSRIIRSGLAGLGLVLLAAVPAAAQGIGSAARADSLAATRPIRLGLEDLPPIIPTGFELSLSRFSPFTRMSFPDYVSELERSAEARGRTLRSLGMRQRRGAEVAVAQPEPEVRADTVEFLPPLVVRDTSAAGGVLPGMLSKYADLDMRVRGLGELGGAWTRYTPCDPSMQLNCNPGLFPQIKPEVQLGLLVAGTVSDRVHVDVDYDQAREETFNSNRIRVYYEGLPNEIVRHVEVGDVQFRIPRSRYLTQGIPAGNFGFMAEGQFGPVDFQTVWAQQRGDLTRREFRLGGGGTQGVVQDGEIVLDDADYVKGQFFFLVHPDSLTGAPFVDALKLLPTDAPASLRPAQGGTIQLYRDERIPASSGQQQVDLFLADAISEDGTLKHSGQFRRLDPDQDYVIHTSGVWIMLRSPLRADEALAVAYVTESGDTVGEINAEQSPAGVVPKLRLLRSPVASHQPGEPTWPFEMHQVYRMNSGTGVDPSTVDLRISLGDLAGGRTFRDTPNEQVTFLRLFGLDEDAPTDKIDAVQLFQPETLQGGATGSARVTGTYVIFPSLEPFRSPGPVPSAGLDAAGALALLGTDANSTIYENTDPVTRESAGRFRLNFSYRVQVDGVVSSFSLGQFGIREGSEVVRLGDRRLERDVDYTIDYELGQITLNDAQALFGANPNAQLTVDLEQKALFQVAPTSLFGTNLTWQLGDRGTFSLVGLYQSEKTLYARPQLGTEPAGVFMGGTSLDLQLGGAWLDRWIARAPFLRSNVQSHFNLQGELAFSAKNPNKRGQGWLDDFEGTDEVGLSVRRQDWKLGSRPESPAGDEGVLPAAVDATTTARLTWQHDFTVNGSIGGSLYPQRDIDNQIVVVGNAVPEPVMWMTFGDSALAAGERAWRSITTVLSTTGRDMSRSEFFEFYARAGQAVPLALVFDIGSVSEDAMYVDSLGRTNGTYESDGRPWGLGLLDEEARVADREVWGLDKDKRGLWDQPCMADGIKAYPLGDPRSNCTRGNGMPDTEDLDGNGVLELNDGAYFRFVVRLGENSPYMVRDTSATGTGFRLYRIPLRTGTPVNGASDGTWRFIKHVRMTVVGEPSGTPRIITLARMRIIGSRWTKRDLYGILRGFAEQEAGAGAGTTELSVGPVSRLTVGASYQSPPGVTNQLQDPTAQYGSTGVEVNEKAQRIEYQGLLPGERAEAYYRYPQQPRSLMEYRQLRMWAVARNGDWGPGHSERLILKIGTDSRNFYLYQTPLKTATGDAVTSADWLPEITIDFQRWFDLRAQAEEQLLRERPPGITQDTVWSADSTYGIVLEDRARAPNLASVREISLAVWNTGAAPVDGEVWVDDIRLDQPFQEPGAAGNLSLGFGAGDIITGTVGFSHKGAVFQQLSQNADYISTGNFTLSTAIRLDRALPAAWGLDIPVNISHSQSSATPRFLARSDVVASDLTGLRDTGGGTTSFGMRVSKQTPSANPWVGAIVDGTAITLGYDKANSNSVTARNESDGFRGGIDYSRNLPVLDVDVVPGFVERALRAITPARIEASDFFARLVGARLRWTPQRIGFGSNYSRQDSRAFRYNTILVDSTDAAVRPVESPRKGLDNNANIAFQPFGGIGLGVNLRSVRDLLDPELATQQPYELDALRNARYSLGGTDLGWEVNRSMTSTFTFRPTITTWLRPSYTWTNRYGTDRNPSYIELEVLDGDTSAVLQRRFGSDRQIARRLDFQPDALVRGLGASADSAERATRVLYALLRSVQSLSVVWNSALGSQFDRETFQPGGGYRFGFGDLGSFRVIGRDTAVSAAERDDFRASSNLTLPLGAGGTITYSRTKSEGFDVRGGRRTQEQVGWPNVQLRWRQLPVPSALSGFVLAASLNFGYERVERTNLLGLNDPQIRGSTDSQVPLSLNMTFRGGLTAIYTGRFNRGTTVDPTGDGETSGTNHSINLSGVFQPPGFLSSKIKTPLQLQAAYVQDNQRRCRYQAGTEHGACTAFVDTSNRTARLQIDTQLTDVMVGVRVDWTGRKSRVGTRTGSNQFQLAFFGQFNLTPGQPQQGGIR